MSSLIEFEYQFLNPVIVTVLRGMYESTNKNVFLINEQLTLEAANNVILRFVFFFLFLNIEINTNACLCIFIKQTF